jgi:histidinol-phosphate aminotransferase
MKKIKSQIANRKYSRLLAPHIPALAAYIPGEQPKTGGFIKLNTNENPYPPSPKAIRAARAEVAGSLRLYPDPVSTPLRAAAAKVFGLDIDNVLAANGSDELLALCVRAFVPAARGVVVYPEPTYILYRTLAAIHTARTRTVKYPRDYALPDALFKAEGDLLFLANPNSPSGSWIPPSAVRRLAASFPGVVVADEAYADFAPATAAPLVKKVPNLVVLRSFSKSHSLAGMRLGLALANPVLIEALRKVQDSYPLDRVAIAAGAAAIADTAWTRRNVEKVKAARSRLTASLSGMGVEVLPSQSNFILARFSGLSAKNIHQGLKRRKILVRYFDEPDLRDALRISVGTDAECGLLAKALKEIIRPALYKPSARR